MAGYTAGELKALSDICLEAAERETFKVQVYHLPIYHSICADAENIFLVKNNLENEHNIRASESGYPQGLKALAKKHTLDSHLTQCLHKKRRF